MKPSKKIYYPPKPTIEPRGQVTLNSPSSNETKHPPKLPLTTRRAILQAIRKEKG